MNVIEYTAHQKRNTEKNVRKKGTLTKSHTNKKVTQNFVYFKPECKIFTYKMYV